ncbi:MAG: 3-dehydroquinate synthase [Bacteroidales bacterium]|jgi:3-dehydroquinate synthase|nr:3-dehydroquinate synthase [Bacteroidales bacterium]
MIVRTFNVPNNVEFSIYSEVDYSWFESLILGRDTVIISDSNIFDLYPDIIKKYKNIILEAGENLKSTETILDIIKKLIEYNVDRNSLLIGFGGGVICDITGFVASIYMRGISFGFVPTTLLAQIDASVGGKNGINFGYLKNYIGTISQPEFIICDTNLLKTLPVAEYKSGLGEVLKYSLICNYELFDILNEYNESIKYIYNDFLDSIVKSCIKSKLKIVQQDVNDHGYRHILNFGHTFGHCFEITENLPHGIAVVKGMIVAMDLSLKSGYMNEKAYKTIMNTIKKLDFEINYTLTEEHLKLLGNDKKKNGNTINFVFLKDIGDAFISKVKTEDLIAALS